MRFCDDESEEILVENQATREKVKVSAPILPVDGRRDRNHAFMDLVSGQTGMAGILLVKIPQGYLRHYAPKPKGAMGVYRKVPVSRVKLVFLIFVFLFSSPGFGGDSKAEIGCRPPEGLKAAPLEMIRSLPKESYTNAVLEKSPTNQSFEDGSRFAKDTKIEALAGESKNLVLFRGIQSNISKAVPALLQETITQSLIPPLPKW